LGHGTAAKVQKAEERGRYKKPAEPFEVTIVKLICRTGAMYSWATPEYILDSMSIDELLLFYDEGVEFTQFKGKIDSAEFLKMRYGVVDEPDKNTEEKKPENESATAEEVMLKFGSRNAIEIIHKQEK
jgi:hypothetical protein